MILEALNYALEQSKMEIIWSIQYINSKVVCQTNTFTLILPYKQAKKINELL